MRPLLHLRDAHAPGILFHQESGEAQSKTSGRDKAGTVTKAQVKEIAEKKMKDLNCDTIEAAMRMVEGSARAPASLGWRGGSKRGAHR
jgi:ribosomal protein L11